ncbi:MAG: Nif3-like dinuclear metal center hexameric protein [Clostridium sp.]
MICSDLCSLIESRFPLQLAEGYDNVGLLLGRSSREIRRVLIALEITPKVISEAINREIDVIISHHPLIFKPLKKITDVSYIDSMVLSLIENNIAVYSSHTNFDIANGGMNDLLCSKIGLSSIENMLICKRDKLLKVVVFVPKGHEEYVKSAMMDSGAGHIGEYSHCSFQIEGIGSFKPRDGANPYIGTKGIVEAVSEVKIETIVLQEDLNRVLSNMIHVHPYEEVAYDIYPLENTIDYSIGRIGILKEEMKFHDFCNYIKDVFSLKNIIVSGDFTKNIKKVGVVGGSGSDLLDTALKKGCDCLITGDVKHHNALDFSNRGINIIDLTHYGSEIIFKEYFFDFLINNTSLEVFISNQEENPLNII